MPTQHVNELWQEVHQTECCPKAILLNNKHFLKLGKEGTIRNLLLNLVLKSWMKRYVAFE